MMQHGLRKLHRLFVVVTRALNVTGTITHVFTRDPVAALTFDDGPRPEFTPHLLDILDRHGAQATFFMVGQAAQNHPELVQQIAQAGHAIGNHSWDHPSFPLITGRERRAQLRACAKAIAPYGQPLFRPPYGHQSTASRLDAFWLGYQVVTWNLHAYDWLDHDANWMVNRLMNQIRPGSIVLLHDTLFRSTVKRATDRKPMLDAVNMLLERLGQSFHFVTVPELLRHGLVQRINWQMKPNADWLNVAVARAIESGRDG
jgi:peptidoglycan/xylan/chitin deacetylase (PgdA/CDA1 family)